MAEQVNIVQRDKKPELDKNADSEFDTENVRKWYTNRVKEYLSKQTVDIDKPWDCTIIEKLIEDVKKGKECIKMHLTRTGDQYKAMKKYSINQANDGKYNLTLKSTKQQQVIPCDESFPAVMKAHRYVGHTNKEKIYDTLKSSYFFPKWCVDIMEQVCNVCQKYKCILYKSSRKYNEKGNADVINLPKPDGYFKYLLIYEEMFTEYVHLRALKEKSDDELAMELMQIFMDFGPPTFLYTSNKKLFRRALDTVNVMCCLPSAVVTESRNNTKHLHVIAANILKWTTDNESDHWSLGCQIVQWEHNNTPLSNGFSPYEMVFGHKPYIKSITEDDNEVVDQAAAVSAQGIAKKKKLCKQCNTTLTDSIYMCNRCYKGVHKICCQYNIGKLLCFSCRDKENLLVKLKSTSNKIQQLIIMEK